MILPARLAKGPEPTAPPAHPSTSSQMGNLDSALVSLRMMCLCASEVRPSIFFISVLVLQCNLALLAALVVQRLALVDARLATSTTPARATVSNALVSAALAFVDTSGCSLSAKSLLPWRFCAECMSSQQHQPWRHLVHVHGSMHLSNGGVHGLCWRLRRFRPVLCSGSCALQPVTVLVPLAKDPRRTVQRVHSTMFLHRESKHQEHARVRILHASILLL